MWCVAECDAVVMLQNVIQCCMMCSNVDLVANDCIPVTNDLPSKPPPPGRHMETCIKRKIGTRGCRLGQPSQGNSLAPANVLY